MPIVCVKCQTENAEAVVFCQKCREKISAVPNDGLFRQQYKIDRLLSEDAVSFTYLAQDVRTGQDCRVREFMPATNNKDALALATRLFVTEGRALRNPIPGGAQVKILFNHERRYYVVEEFVSGPTIADLRQAEPPSEGGLHALLDQLLGVVEGWAMSQPPFVHGDLRAGNVVRRREDGALVATDWARIKDETQIAFVYDQAVTLSTTHLSAFAPPERRSFSLSAQSDLYGVAIVCTEYWTGKSADEIFDSRLGTWRLESCNLPGPVEVAFSRLLDLKPEKRSNGAEVRKLLNLIEAAESARASTRLAAALKAYEEAYSLQSSPFLKRRIDEAERALSKAEELRSHEEAVQSPSAAAHNVPSPPPPAVPTSSTHPPTTEGSVRPVFPRTPIAIAKRSGTMARQTVPPPVTVQAAPVVRKSRTGYLLIAIGALVLIALLYFLIFASPEKNIIAAVNDNRLLEPVSSSAYELYRKARSASQLDKDAIARISAVAIPKIDSAGDTILTNFHDHSQASEADWSNLVKLYDWAIDMDPTAKNRARSAYANAQVALRSGHLDAAEAGFRQATEAMPDWALAHNGLARVAYRRKDYEAAAVSYRRAIELEPNWLFPHENLCALYFNMKNWDLSEEECQNVVRMDPQSDLGYYFLGIALERTNRPCDAVNAYRSAMRYEDSNAPFRGDVLQKKIEALSRRNHC